MKIGRRGELSLQGLYMEPFGVNVLEGYPEFIRRRELERYRGLVEQLFPYSQSLWVGECPSEIDNLYTVIAKLRRYESGSEEYDCSTLRILAFHPGLPTNPIEFLESLLQGIEWINFAEFHLID